MTLYWLGELGLFGEGIPNHSSLYTSCKRAGLIMAGLRSMILLLRGIVKNRPPMKSQAHQSLIAAQNLLASFAKHESTLRLNFVTTNTMLHVLCSN